MALGNRPRARGREAARPSATPVSSVPDSEDDTENHCTRLCPVISAGCGRPSIFRRVGATSARMPLSTRTLPPKDSTAEMRDQIEDKTVIYAMDVIMENLRFGRPADFVEVEAGASAIDVMKEYEGRPRSLHPAVWTRSTGQKVLHVSGWMAQGIEGHEDADGEALLAAVCDEIVHAAKELSYFHQWQPTDMLIWDNWRLLHSVSGMPPENLRTMHRTTIAGDYGLGRFEDAAH